MKPGLARRALGSDTPSFGLISWRIVELSCVDRRHLPTFVCTAIFFD
jgi:hypothetical protein